MPAYLFVQQRGINDFKVNYISTNVGFQATGLQTHLTYIGNTQSNLIGLEEKSMSIILNVREDGTESCLLSEGVIVREFGLDIISKDGIPFYSRWVQSNDYMAKTSAGSSDSEVITVTYNEYVLVVLGRLSEEQMLLKSVVLTLDNLVKAMDKKIYEEILDALKRVT